MKGSKCMIKLENKMGKILVGLFLVFSIIGIPISTFAEEPQTTPTPTVSPSPSPSQSPVPTASPTPSVKPTTLTIDKQSIELIVGEEATIQATVTGADGIDSSVTWTSSDPQIATVDASGNVKALAAGTVTVTVTMKADASIEKTCAITVKEKEVDKKKSSDKKLKSLTVTNAKISPTFTPTQYKYTLIVSSGNKEVSFKYEKNHEKQKVHLPETENLVNGSTISIAVTAEDGSQQAYEFKVVKEVAEVIGLKSLKIKGYTLNEPFSNNRTGYTVDIPYEAEDVSIEVEKASTDLSVDIKGASNLKVGKNEVTVTVKDRDGNKKVYIITVTRAAKVESETDDKNEDDSVTSHQSSSGSTILNSDISRKDHTLKYFFVTVGCLILFSIGGIGIYFFVKTSNKNQKKKGKHAPHSVTIEEKIETSIVEVAPGGEELEKTIEFTEEATRLENQRKVLHEKEPNQNVLKEIEDLFEEE